MIICPVCANKNELTISHIAVVEQSQRVLCLMCNCAFISPLPLERPVYDGKYNAEFCKPSERNKAIVMAQEIQLWLGYGYDGPPVLEVGPGNGWTLAEMAKLGIPCMGVETDPLWATQLSHENLITVHGCGFENLPDEKKYGIIYSSHVIEHLPSPIPYLEKAKMLLTEGGRIIIDTPDLDCPRRLTADWHHFQTRTPFEHLCVLSKQAIGVAAAITGLKLAYFRRAIQYESFLAVLVA